MPPPQQNASTTSDATSTSPPQPLTQWTRLLSVRVLHVANRDTPDAPNAPDAPYAPEAPRHGHTKSVLNLEVFVNKEVGVGDRNTDV